MLDTLQRILSVAESVALITGVVIAILQLRHQTRIRQETTSLMVVSVFFESLGLLLKRGLAPIELLDDLLSGPILDALP